MSELSESGFVNFCFKPHVECAQDYDIHSEAPIIMWYMCL